MGEDVHHGEEEHTGGGSLGADIGLQLHNLIGFSTHQSCWCGVVKGKARDGEFQYLPEWDRTITRASDDDSPGPGIHDVEKNPQDENGDEPVACMTDVCPELGKRHLECEQHHNDSDESEGKENVTGLAFQLSLFLPR